MRRLTRWCVSPVILAGLGCQPPESSTETVEAIPVTRGEPTSSITREPEIAPKATVAEATEPGATVKTASGLSYSTLIQGEGTPVVSGDKVAVQARGTFEDGKVFLDTAKAGKPWTFVIGDPEVVLGVNEGVAGMKPGERRKLILPPQIGYGSLGTFAGEPKEGQPVIPPNSTLIYEIELLKPES